MADKDEKQVTGVHVAMMAELAKNINLEALEDLIREGERYDTIEPLFDPTAWMRNHKGMNAATRVLIAARAFTNTVLENVNKSPVTTE